MPASARHATDTPVLSNVDRMHRLFGSAVQQCVERLASFHLLPISDPECLTSSGNSLSMPTRSCTHQPQKGVTQSARLLLRHQRGMGLATIAALFQQSLDDYQVVQLDSQRMRTTTEQVLFFLL